MLFLRSYVHFISYKTTERTNVKLGTIDHYPKMSVNKGVGDVTIMSK